MSGWTAIGLRLAPWDDLATRERGPIAEDEDQAPLPTPRTLSGALRTAILRAQGFDFAAYERLVRSRRGPNSSSEPQCDARGSLRAAGASEDALNAIFRGPWLALASDPNSGDEASATIEPLLPTPTTLVRSTLMETATASWHRAIPWESGLPGWEDDEIPLWRSKGPRQAQYPGGYLTPTGISAFLAGNCPNDSDWWSPAALYSSEPRSARASADARRIAGRLTLHSQARANPDRGQSHREGWRVVLYAEIWMPNSSESFALSAGRMLEQSVIALGRGGRPLTTTALPRPFDWSALQPSIPDASSESESQPESEPRLTTSYPPNPRSLWLLTTPAPCAAGAARPRDLSSWFGPEAVVRSASAGAPISVSGWDVAAGRRLPDRRAIPAGAVLHLTGPIDFPSAGIGADSDSPPGSAGSEVRRDSGWESALSPPICIGPDPEDRAQGWGQVLRGAWREACP